MVVPGKPGSADYDAVGSDLIADLNRESSPRSRPAKPFGTRIITRITISPKTTSCPCSFPMIGALPEISGRSAMKSAPTIVPQREPRPATAAPIRS